MELQYCVELMPDTHQWNRNWGQLFPCFDNYGTVVDPCIRK